MTEKQTLQFVCKPFVYMYIFLPLFLIAYFPLQVKIKPQDEGPNHVFIRELGTVTNIQYTMYLL
jgi:hypothetical protein